jgi:RNA recognition motif-containing protein
MSIRLYVGNLPKSDVERDELQTVFADAGDLVSVKVIKDRKTGKCRGFGFVTVETDEQADQIIEKYNGTMFQELPIKIEKALPKAKGQDDEDGEASLESLAPFPNQILAIKVMLVAVALLAAVIAVVAARKVLARKVLKARLTTIIIPTLAIPIPTVSSPILAGLAS